MAVYAGIDPGFTGALAIINERGQVLEVTDAPMLKHVRKMDRVAVREICERIAKLRPDRLAIEQVHGMPGDGGAAAFKFGEGYEVWKSALYYAGIEPMELSPMKWKARLCLPGKRTNYQSKKLSVMRARELFPDCFDHLRYWNSDGRAEAMLIAHYLRITSLAGMHAIVRKYGKDSNEAWELALGGLNKFNRRMRPASQLL